MQIAVIVPLRYPTEKAYGVNIAYTAEALRTLGNDINIFTAGGNSVDSQGNSVIGIKNIPLRIAAIVRDSNYPAVRAFGFYLFQFIFAIYAYEILRKSETPELVLTRSPIVAFVLSRVLSQETRIILELHHIPSSLEKFFINKSTQNISLVVTNTEFGSQLKQIGVKRTYDVVANAAPNTFHNLSRTVHKYYPPIKIGYAGKSTSSGHDNGLAISIKLLENCPELVGRIHFTFIGCESSFRSKVQHAIERGTINESSITMIDHLPHDKLLAEIARFDLALIPYPEEPYYERSFPIKIAEMASAGIPMLISNTKAHRRILGEPNDFYFTPGSYSSLKLSLEKILGNIDSIPLERERIILLSRDFTYSKRARDLLQVGNK